MGGCELFCQIIDGLLLILKLLFHHGDGFLHLGIVVGGLFEALFQFRQALFVLVDGLLDENDVVAQLLLAVRGLAT